MARLSFAPTAWGCVGTDDHGCECAEQVDFDGEPARTVTLVHGTYAKHAAWMRDGAKLPSALSEEGDTALFRFCWSGRNRQTDRLHGGEKLHDHLVEIVNRYPDAEHAEHAHSHGGSVAMYALRDSDCEPDPQLNEVEVITMATPFLTMSRRRVSPSAYFFFALVILIAFDWIISPSEEIVGVEDTFWTVVAWVARVLVCSTVAATLASGELAMGAIGCRRGGCCDQRRSRTWRNVSGRCLWIGGG